MPPKKPSAEPAAVLSKDPETAGTEPDAKPDAGGKAAARKVPPHPSTMEMVKEALKELDSRKGVSAQAIRGYIKEKYTSVDETRLKFMVRRSLAKGLETGAFVRPANSAPTTTGAQGRFRIAAKTKAKEAKAQTKENADPNVQKASKPKKAKTPKAKSDGTGKETQKSTKKKKAATDDAKPKTPEREGSASKVAPAKKPKAKNAAGEGGTEPKPSKAKKPKAAKKADEEPAAAKRGKKTAAKGEEDDSGEKAVTTAKASGKRGKK